VVGETVREIRKAMGMVATNVLEAVKGEPRSTVISNINRRIDALEARNAAINEILGDIETLLEGI
jgi:hypothetical protein